MLSPAVKVTEATTARTNTALIRSIGVRARGRRLRPARRGATATTSHPIAKLRPRLRKLGTHSRPRAYFTGRPATIQAAKTPKSARRTTSTHRGASPARPSRSTVVAAATPTPSAAGFTPPLSGGSGRAGSASWSPCAPPRPGTRARCVRSGGADAIAGGRSGRTPRGRDRRAGVPSPGARADDRRAGRAPRPAASGPPRRRSGRTSGCGRGPGSGPAAPTSIASGPPPSDDPNRRQSSARVLQSSGEGEGQEALQDLLPGREGRGGPDPDLGQAPLQGEDGRVPQIAVPGPATDDLVPLPHHPVRREHEMDVGARGVEAQDRLEVGGLERVVGVQGRRPRLPSPPAAPGESRRAAPRWASPPAGSARRRRTRPGSHRGNHRSTHRRRPRSGRRAGSARPRSGSPRRRTAGSRSCSRCRSCGDPSPLVRAAARGPIRSRAQGPRLRSSTNGATTSTRSVRIPPRRCPSTKAW